MLWMHVDLDERLDPLLLVDFHLSTDGSSNEIPLVDAGGAKQFAHNL